MVRDLLWRCARTSDRAERAALYGRLASVLERLAEDALADDRDAARRELAAGLRGQSSMLGFVADIERRDLARGATSTRRAAG